MYIKLQIILSTFFSVYYSAVNAPFAPSFDAHLISPYYISGNQSIAQVTSCSSSSLSIFCFSIQYFSFYMIQFFKYECKVKLFVKY